MKKFFAMLLTVALLLSVLSVAALAEGKTIVYWSMWESAEPQAQVIRKAVDAYMAATGNKVDLQFKGRTGIREGLEPAIGGGTEIDLFDEDIDRVNKTWGKYLYNLEELSKKTDYEATALKSMIAACRDAGSGQLMSIPYQPFVFNIFYNKEIMEKAGISEIPTDWAGFVAMCEKIKAAGFVPLTSDDAYVHINFGYHLARYIGEAGVEKVVKEGLWAEEPAVLKAAQDYEAMFTKGYLSATMGSSAWPTNQNGEFALGDVAMYLNGSWLPNEIKAMTGPDYKWGCMAYPAVEGGKDGIEAANFGSQVLAINKDSKNVEEAFEIIRYITKGEYDKMLSQESLGIPSDASLEEWPKQLEDVKALMPKLSTRYNWGAGIESNADMTPIIKENFQKLVSGLQNAQQFVDALEATGK